MRSHSELLDLLRELQTLDRVPRSGYFLRGVSDPESVSEHLFHVALLAWTLASRESDLDRHRVLELALVHDLAEVRTGDLPKPAAAYLPDGAKTVAERAVGRDLFPPLGPEIAQIFEEYLSKSSREARFVGACDKLQLLIKTSVYEDWGCTGLGEFWHSFDSLANGEFETVRRLTRELLKRRGVLPRGGSHDTAPQSSG